MKILHTSDWQMGMKAAQTGEASRKVREARFETADRIVKLAKEEAVEFILIAGDTFENMNIDDDVVRKTVKILNDAYPIPVYILPGNHDPFMRGSIWERRSWKSAGENVHLMVSSNPIMVSDKVILYPCPIIQKTGRKDLTADIPKREPGDDRIRIGVAHGNTNNLGDEFPIPLTRADESDLDYLALGHWHGKNIFGKMAYSGTHEQTSFDDKDPGNVFIVEIRKAGVTTKVTPIRVGKLFWRTIEQEVRDNTDLEKIVTDVNTIPNKLDTLVKIRITGIIPEEGWQESLLKENIEKFLFLDIDNSNCSEMSFTLDNIPKGFITQMNDDLLKILSGQIPEGPAKDYSVTDKEVLQEAYKLFAYMLREE